MSTKSQDWNIVTLKEYVERVFSERQTAMEAALISAKEAVAASFAASDKAITKAEDAQREYNSRSNEFRASLDDQAKMLLSRTEADTRFNQLRDLIDAQQKQIGELQKGASRGEGGLAASTESKSDSQWRVGYIIIPIASLFLGALGSLLVGMALYYMTRK